MKLTLAILLTISPLMAAQVGVGEGASSSVADLAAKLDQQVLESDLAADNMAAALLEIGSRYKIPMGIEWVMDSGTLSPVRLSLGQVTVRQAIRAVLSKYSPYQMREKDGILHIWGPGLVSGKQDFLKLRIPKFDASGVPASVAERNLRALVMNLISPPPPSGGAPSGSGHSYGVEADEPNINVSVRDATVEKILDLIALTSDRAIWIVTFRPSGEVTPSGYRRSLTLWNDLPMPDAQQPVWDTLRWGHPFPARVQDR